MAKVKNQNIPAQEVIYDPDPARPHTVGEAYIQALTEGHHTPVEAGVLVVQKSPRQGRPGNRGPGTPGQKPGRDCMKCCGEMWRRLPQYFKDCVKQAYNNRPAPARDRQVSPEWFSTPMMMWGGQCQKACLDQGGCEFDPETLFNCPDPRCAGAYIGYTTLSLMVNECLSLTIEGGEEGAPLTFALISGGGSVTPTGLYCAPASNPGCVNNATVGLYCGSYLQDQVEITVNAYPTCYVASREFVCQTQGQCGGVCYYRTYDCNGTLVIPNPCTPGDLGECSECVNDPNPLCLQVTGGGVGIYTEAAEYYNCPLQTGDLRSEAAIEGGCCPPLF